MIARRQKQTSLTDPQDDLSRLLCGGSLVYSVASPGQLCPIWKMMCWKVLCVLCILENTDEIQIEVFGRNEQSGCNSVWKEKENQDMGVGVFPKCICN